MAGKLRIVVAEGIIMLDTHAVSRILGMSEVTLRRWRVGGRTSLRSHGPFRAISSDSC
jgi:hypothetical protein